MCLSQQMRLWPCRHGLIPPGGGTRRLIRINGSSHTILAL
jgi:hypothetical protein